MTDTAPAYFGVDYSTTRTGLAVFTGGEWETTSLPSSAEESRGSLRAYYDRIASLSGRITSWMDPDEGDVVAVERIAYNGKGSAVDRLHYAWHTTVRDLTEHHGEPWLITATSLKLLATGNGRASKTDMLASARAIGAAPANHDEADAVWLAVAASVIDGHPIADLDPARTRKLIEKATP